tara:strand:- start:23030 stop:23674 length:645 start_codon:yes stop_codon:yes gene_type:complete
MKKDLGHLREIYKKSKINKRSLGDNPLLIFSKWFSEAETHPMIREPNAFKLSTIGLDGFPNARMVLLKSFGDDGFIFCTNYNSFKGREIKINPKVLISFYWSELERQVIIKGTVTKTSNKISDQYFNSRPTNSKISALVSNQSEIIKNRSVLDNQHAILKSRYKNRSPKRPEHWGAYNVTPNYYEFWQGREDRLHDRIIYTIKSNNWEINRLSP